MDPSCPPGAGFTPFPFGKVQNPTPVEPLGELVRPQFWRDPVTIHFRVAICKQI